MGEAMGQCKILEQFLEGCRQRKLDIDTNFAKYYIKIMARDARDGLNMSRLNACGIQKFLENLMKKYGDSLDATMCNLKLSHFHRNIQELLKIDGIKKKYDLEYQTKLKILIDDILQYPETSNDKQIETMFRKMQVFIVTGYNLGCPKNHVLLKQTKDTLKGVLGKKDLRNYVLKKKHHRLEFLQRLSAIVCGILIYNNLGPQGDRENMRDIRAELLMAHKNTDKGLRSVLRKVTELKQHGINTVKTAIELDIRREKVRYYCSVEDVRDVNKFVVLYFKYESVLKELIEAFEKTDFVINNDLAKVKCVFSKIDEALKNRTAVDSEVIFPHFVYLSKLWQMMLLYLDHFVEINKIRDILESYVTKAIDKRFLRNTNKIKEKVAEGKNLIERNFKAISEQLNVITPRNADFLQIQNDTSEFCTLTIAITNGLLVPAGLQKKFCKNLKRKFGFRNFKLANYAELHYDNYLKTFKDVVFTSVDLILLFNLDKQIMKSHSHAFKDSDKQTNEGTQTEMVVVGDLSAPNKINTTFNKWDFHRETIRLANLTQCQTHSAQTCHSFAQRNAQNQANNTRRNI